MQGEVNPGYIGLVDEGPKEDPPPYEKVGNTQSNIYDDIDELGLTGIHGINDYQNSHMEKGYLGEGVYPNRDAMNDYITPKNLQE